MESAAQLYLVMLSVVPKHLAIAASLYPAFGRDGPLYFAADLAKGWTVEGCCSA